MPAGRPSEYSIELAERLCERIAAPMSLSKACEPEDMPAMSTVFKWLRKHPQFVEIYAKATEERTEAQAEEMLDIADDGRNDYMESLGEDGQVTGYKQNAEAIQRSRLRVDTRKWLMAKMKPKKYGDKTTTELTGANGGPVQIQSIQIEAVDPD